MYGVGVGEMGFEGTVWNLSMNPSTFVDSESDEVEVILKTTSSSSSTRMYGREDVMG